MEIIQEEQRYATRILFFELHNTTEMTYDLKCNSNMEYNFKRRFEELQKDNAELKDSREKLLAEKFHLLSQTQIAIRENDKLTDSNVALEGRVNELKLDIEHLRDEVKEANSANLLSNLREENEHLRKQLQASHDAELLSEGRVKLLKSENKRLEEQLETAHKSISGTKVDLKMDDKNLREEVETANNARLLLEGRVKLLTSDSKRLEEEMDGALKASQLAETKLNELKLDNKRLEEEAIVALNARHSLQGQVELLTSENKRLVEEKESAFKSNQLSETKINGLKLDNEHLREEVENAHNARQLAEKKLIDKLRETRDQGSTIKELATQCGSVMGHQNHSQKIKYMVKLKNENVELKSKVTRLEAELAAAKRNSARPLTTGTREEAKENVAPRQSSTAARKITSNAASKTTLKSNAKSAGSLAKPAPGLGNRRAISKK